MSGMQCLFTLKSEEVNTEDEKTQIGTSTPIGIGHLTTGK